MAPGENEAKNPLLCINITSLAICGLLPFQNEKFLNNKKLRRVHFILGFIAFLIFVMFVITEYIELFVVWGKLEEMTINMTVSCLYGVTALKVYNLFGHRKKIYSLIEDISRTEVNIIKYQNNEVKSILRDYIKMARRATYLFWSVAVVTLSIFFVLPALEYRFSSTYHRIYDNGTEYWSYVRPTVFSSWFPFDRFAYPNYIFVYIFQVAMGTVGGSYTSCWDMFAISMIVHSIGQLRILRRNLIVMTEFNPKLDEEFKSKIINDVKFRNGSRTEISEAVRNMWDDVKHKRLVDCINHHRHIRKYTEEFNTLMRPSMMLYFILCSLTLCATLFQASLYGLSVRLFFMIEYVLSMMTQLLLFYWHSNEVIIERERLAFALYSCEWFNENKRFKTNLMILREGIKLPINYTVGPFYAMSLPTFVAILRASYSYFALLRQTQEKQQNH